MHHPLRRGHVEERGQHYWIAFLDGAHQTSTQQHVLFETSSILRGHALAGDHAVKFGHEGKAAIFCSVAYAAFVIACCACFGTTSLSFLLHEVDTLSLTH